MSAKPSDTKIIKSGEVPTTLTLPRCKLVVMEGDDAGQERTIDKGVIHIGSAERADLALSDETVSREHAEIHKTREGYLLRDLGSTNGTFVGGLKVKEAYLTTGALIKVGKTKIKFTPKDEKIEIFPSKKTSFGGIMGKSLEMRRIFGILEKIAQTNVSCVVTGETGTGKELIAKAIHSNSRREKKPFVVFDCSAVAETLVESELFGHEKGSFTGATTTRQGAFEVANSGTIFLDEIGEMNLDLQPKLLRALEQGEIKRVGADKPRYVDVRVVCATNRDLREEVKKGRFREDLYFRISVVQINIPPLRKRMDDLELLVRHFIERNLKGGEENKKTVTEIDEEAMRLLHDYSWPGNIRELKNAVDRAISFCEGNTITIKDLPEYLRERSVITGSHPKVDGALPFKEAKERWIESFERDYLIELLRKNNLNISKAAKEAGIDRKSVQRLLKKYNLNVKDL